MNYALIVWTLFLPLRDVPHLTGILKDVESHLPAGHGYSDPDRITTVHESTHGINSLLRQRYGCPAFYVLNNRAVLMKEPTTTLSYASVANMVPPSLRGEVYHLYLKQMQRWWNFQPTYVFDELTAYSNGAEARKQLGIKDRQETVRYAVEFIVYSSCVPMASHSTDTQMKEFLKWQIERVIALSGRGAYLDKLRTSSDAKELRDWMRNYYGATWTKKVLGL
jgi:hypothetical protein